MNQVVWQVATVVDMSPGRVKLVFDPLSACKQCLRGEGCGAGVFSRLFSRRQALIWLDHNQEFRVGQKLRVGLAASNLLYGAMILYGLPVLTFVVGVLIGQGLVGSGVTGDLVALIGGLILAGSVLLFFRRRPLHGLNPRIEPLSCTSSGCDA